MLWCLYGILLILTGDAPNSLATSVCPPGCCCPKPSSLVLCESLGLKNLPRSVPLKTTVLSVARNHLCNVDHLLMPFLGLRELSLSQNELSHFPRGLPRSLESLQLQENKITYLTSGGLRHLGNLTRLDLEDNCIQAIQAAAFLGLNRLQVLNLKGNRLSSFPQSLPPSLLHLDLSANCISTMDIPILVNLVNLQVLKINSNCLRSVPESAFDGLPWLRTVELADNPWICECEILYLYRWLLNGRLRMATDLVCRAPVHLADHLLLTVPVITICPRIMKPNDKDKTNVASGIPDNQMFQSAHKNILVVTQPLPTTSRPSFRRFFQVSEDHTDSLHELPDSHFSLEKLNYKHCLFLNGSSALQSPTDKSLHFQQLNSTGSSSVLESTTTPGDTISIHATEKAGFQSPILINLFSVRNSAAIIAVLATLGILVALVLMVVLVMLKKILQRNQRVAPINHS